MTCLLFLWKRAGHTLLPCNLSPKLQGATANKKLPYFMVPKTLSVWRIIIQPLGRKDCLTSRARRRSCRSSQSCFPWLSQLLSSSPNTFGCWWRICHNPLCTSSPSGLNPHAEDARSHQVTWREISGLFSDVTASFSLGNLLLYPKSQNPQPGTTFKVSRFSQVNVEACWLVNGQFYRCEH